MIREQDGKILTLCMAAYNAEQYIERAIQSVIDAQRLQEIELLIINDGSSDNTERIALKYAALYPETVRCFSKENGGAGSAWNMGIEKASGRFFRLLDADDYVDSQGLAQLTDALDSEGSDLILTDYKKVYPDKEKQISFYKRFEPAAGRDISYIRGTLFAMHAATFRTELLKRHGMRMSERTLYTDFEFIMYPIPYVETVSYYGFNVYMYSIGIEGQSVSAEVKKKHMDHNLRVLYHITDYYLEIQRRLSLSDGQRDVMEAAIIHQYMLMLTMYLRYHAGEIREIAAFDRRVGLSDVRLRALSGKYVVVRLLRRTDYRLCPLAGAWYRLKHWGYKIYARVSK